MNTSKWAFFRIDDLFVVKKGKRLTKEEQIPGKTPYIGAVDSNNGVTNYIDKSPIHEGNTISLSYNGSVGEAFYQAEPFWATDDVNVLYPKFNMTKNIALFICPILRLEKYRFAYGRKWTLEKMKASVIRLPIKNGNPDWQFMENYIGKKYNKFEKKTITKIKQKKKRLNVSNWVQFKISDIFECSIACSEDFGNLVKGKLPFIGRSEKDNGLQGYVDTDKLNRGQCITIGMVGTMEPYWQEDDFVASQNILVLRNNELNKYSALFLVAVLRRIIADKYSYNRPIQKEKFKNSFIKLPSDSHDMPDWNFMEGYIKSLPYSDLI